MGGPHAEDTFRFLETESQCIMGLMIREFLRLEMYGAKNFNNSQYRCRHLAVGLGKLMGEAHMSGVHLPELIATRLDEVREKMAFDLLRDLDCLSTEILEALAKVQAADDITDQSDVTQVGRDLLGTFMAFASVKQDVHILAMASLAFHH